MQVITSAGTKIFIGTTAPASDLAAFEEDTYVEIGDVEDLGEFGDSAEIVEFVATNDARVRKSKGARDAGNQSLMVGYNPDDAGQIALDDAEATNQAYNIKVERDDQITPDTGNPTTDFFRAIVAGRRKNYGQNNNIQRVSYELAITSEILNKEAS